MTELAAATAAIVPDPGATPSPPVSPTGPGGVVPPVAEPGKTELSAAEAPKKDEGAAPAVEFDATKLQLPEGLKTDDPLFKSFSDTLSDAKLDPQARGQKLLDLYRDGIKTVSEANAKAWNDLNAQWIGQVKADPEIGGAKFNEVKTTIARAIDGLGPELSVAFRQGLDATGAGNHPAIWKGLAKMAALLSEGGAVNGNPPKAQPNLADTFFPNSKMV